MMPFDAFSLAIKRIIFSLKMGDSALRGSSNKTNLAVLFKSSFSSKYINSTHDISEIIDRYINSKHSSSNIASTVFLLKYKFSVFVTDKFLGRKEFCVKLTLVSGFLYGVLKSWSFILIH